VAAESCGNIQIVCKQKNEPFSREMQPPAETIFLAPEKVLFKHNNREGFTGEVVMQYSNVSMVLWIKAIANRVIPAHTPKNSSTCRFPKYNTMLADPLADYWKSKSKQTIFLIKPISKLFFSIKTGQSEKGIVKSSDKNTYRGYDSFYIKHYIKITKKNKKKIKYYNYIHVLLCFVGQYMKRVTSSNTIYILAWIHNCIRNKYNNNNKTNKHNCINTIFRPYENMLHYILKNKYYVIEEDFTFFGHTILSNIPKKNKLKTEKQIKQSL
jgi:hypothetical protein